LEKTIHVYPQGALKLGSHGNGDIGIATRILLGGFSLHDGSYEYPALVAIRLRN